MLWAVASFIVDDRDVSVSFCGDISIFEIYREIK